MQGRGAGVEGEAGGDVQQAVAQAFGFGFGELAGRAAVVGSRRSGRARAARSASQTWLWAKVAEREVAQAGVFVVADVVLDAGAAAVVTLELGDRAGLVGEDRLEAVPVVVGERQLRAGVRALAPDDHPRARAASWTGRGAR